MRLYVDMDGVLTDFNGQFKHWFGEDIEVCLYRDDPRVKSLIDRYLPDAPPEFWGDMKWLPGARDFWNELRRWNPEILSAPYNDSRCPQGKRDWCARELEPGVRVSLRENKGLLSREGDILIDDSAYNAEGWKGHFILHQDQQKTLRELRSLLGI